MKSYVILFLIMIVVLVLPGCEIVGAIFKAGFWTAIVLIVIVAALLGWGAFVFFRRRN